MLNFRFQMRKVVAVVACLAVTSMFSGCQDKDNNDNAKNFFVLKSNAFSNNQRLDDKFCYTGIAGGQNISLPFNWEGSPENTQSFALIIYDPDGGNWIHWAVFNIPANCTSIAEGASGKNMPQGSLELNNEFGTSGYGGPQPPTGSGNHRYIVTLYALNTNAITDISGFKNYAAINSLLAGKIIDKASITGTYSK